MATQEHLKESLEHFKQQRQAKIDELRMIEIMIRGLQAQVGEIPEQQAQPDGFIPLSSAFTVFEAKATPRQENPVGENYKPRPDEYFGMGHAEAARTYLEKIGHAMLLDDILKTIVAGGCRVGGVDPKKTLSIVLNQNKRDFVPTGNGNIGLRKFYPNMPKLGRPEGAIPAKKTAKGRAKKVAKRAPRSKASPIKPKPTDTAEQVQVVQ